MNQLRPSSPIADALQARYARRIAAALGEQAGQLSPDLAERLRFAREQALERARAVRTQAAGGRIGVTSSGAALLGGGWWIKVASVVPFVALVCGLVLIQHIQTRAQISSAAEVDAALLADDVPPAAYSDAGFVEFLKTPPAQ